MNKILFHKSINKIKNESVRNYFLTFFCVKNIITKIAFFLIIGLIVLVFSFSIRNYYLKYDISNTVFNAGVAFSFGENLGSSIVMLIQIIPTLISSIFIIFLPKLKYYLPLLFVFYGGLSNVIDRAIPDIAVDGQIHYYTVVDYLKATTSIFNLPDMFIIGGVIWIAIVIVYLFIVTLIEDKNEPKEKQISH